MLREQQERERERAPESARVSPESVHVCVREELVESLSDKGAQTREL